MAGKAKDGEEGLVRLNIRVTPEAYETLNIHCIKAHRRPGDFLSDLIAAHCNDWQIVGSAPVRRRKTG